MIKINKAANEPFVFKTIKQKYATYDDLYCKDKNALKVQLIEEQFYLCAYCMARIKLKSSSIEHYLPRHPEAPDDADRSLDYHNLFAVCISSKNKPDNQKFCEAKRGNTELSINPMLQEHIDTISYSGDGKIISSNQSFQTDIDETLNLNCPLLCRNRRDALSDFIRTMSEKKSGFWSKEYISNVIMRLESREMNVPYVGYIQYFLKRRLNQ